ncbi:putative zinc-finger of transcription factor IIIC complex-domain-containing protein, partial [Gymnopilus junonius]
LQFSADGQVCFATKNLRSFSCTPDHGINFDTSSTISSLPMDGKTRRIHPPGLGLGWFKTMIQHEKITPTRWPEYSQAWGAVSLGSIDLSLTSMAISPSGIAANGGCVYVTLSSNMDVNLWIAGKNYLKGEWSKICDVTPCLLNHAAPKDEEKFNIVAILKAQIVCIDWTRQVDFGILPAPGVDGSLLVLGSRAGCLTFLRYCNNADPEHVQTLSVTEKWITQLACSSWVNVGPGHSEGYVAYGVSDGSIGLVKVTQNLQEDEGGFVFTPSYKIAVTLEHLSDLVIDQSQCSVAITSMQWVHAPGRSPILVSSNPGKINLWSTSSPFHWSGSRTFLLQTQKTSIDSSAFHPVSGITYIPKHDKLIITLFDGSFHVIRTLSFDPTWATRAVAGNGLPNQEQLTSEALSGVSRNVFVKTEKEGMDSGDTLRINGALGYDDDKCFMWVYESARPSDFSYKHDAKHSSMLVVAQMWEDEDDERVLRRLGEVLGSAKTALAFSPLHVLRPFFFHLRNPTKLDHLLTKFLQIITPPDQDQGEGQAEDHSTRISVPSLTGAVLDDEIRGKFRDSLATHLFGWDELLRLRMRLSLGDFAWKHAINEERQAECGVVAQGLLNAISHRVLRTIVRHLVAVVSLLSASDVPFVSRMIVQSLLPGCPPDLSEEGTRLSVLVQPLMEGHAMMPSDEIVTKLNESCPACGVEVPLQDITTAVCANGHRWARCSVTTFILSTPWVRTCVGCSRKAFLPPSAGNDQDLPEIAKGWVVEELLEAVKRCLFCNNAFVSIL